MADKTLTLHVEDDLAIAKLVQIGLRGMPLELHHAANGDSAMEWLDDHHPELILLDINLPGADGWEVLDYAKQKYGARGFKVIVTTARRDAVSRATGEIHHVDKYLIKPYTIQQLEAAIEEMTMVNPDEDEEAYASMDYDEE
ncbi:MAG: response regulator [bacterium]|nr:response regulator [bacterium]